MEHVRESSKNLRLLSELLLASSSERGAAEIRSTETRAQISGLSQTELEEMRTLAMSHHVIMRTFAPLEQVLKSEGQEASAAWVMTCMEDESRRIAHALQHLEPICTELENGGCPVTVIKSLDHWPDLGSDLDLYSSGEPNAVIGVMKDVFNAELAPRSWGDRMANKWNFVVPGLPELVEIHVQRLGQMGEQTAITESLDQRSRTVEVGSHSFRVAAAEDRIVISTLQRMYRHFYMRLCDIADLARFVEAGAVDFLRLRSFGMATGLWDGIATYLSIISSYVEMYRGYGLSLPLEVTSSARFGIDQVWFGNGFLRIPIVPHSAGLYATELKRLLLNGQLANTFRLSLLPCLATAAAVEYKITGSDKGIW